MTDNPNYTDLKTSEMLLKEGVSEIIGEGSAWWIKYKSRAPSGVFWDLCLFSEILNSYMFFDTGWELDNKSVITKIPSYTFHDLWKALPKWVKEWFESKYGFESYKWNCVWDNIEVRFKSIIEEHWDNWLLILSEMLVYLKRQGLLK